MNCKILYIVMPVYNEERVVESVVEEWIYHFKKMNIPFKFQIINDGSTDNTINVCENLARTYSEISVHSQVNVGHGQACIVGYRHGLNEGAQWLLQIDSDGQCDPVYFNQFWLHRNNYDFIFGHRVTRGDGIKRLIISKLLSTILFFRLLKWIPDANVPYRLMRASLLREVVINFPTQFNLANILLTIRIQNKFKIHWVPIYFRDRWNKSDSKSITFFIKMGVNLIRALKDQGN